MRPTVAEIKIHSRIDNDIEDEYLAMLENSCFEFIQSYLNRSVITDSNTELTGTDMYYNDQFKMCELMIIDSWYTDRSTDKVPEAAMLVLNQFRIINT